MLPNGYLQRLAADVSKRCGICQATVEQVLPAVFDEIRQQIVEGKYHSVPIYSFGVFGVKHVPERRYHYYRPEKGIDEWRTKPASKKLKFSPATSFKRQIEVGVFDSSRTSFIRYPGDAIMRRRSNAGRKPNKNLPICKLGQFQNTYPDDNSE